MKETGFLFLTVKFIKMTFLLHQSLASAVKLASKYLSTHSKNQSLIDFNWCAQNCTSFSFSEHFLHKFISKYILKILEWQLTVKCWKLKQWTDKDTKVHISWVPIDLNANVLARNIYFLQIKESFTHSAFVFNVASINGGEKTIPHVTFWEERDSWDAALSAEGVFTKIFVKKIHDF